MILENLLKKAAINLHKLNVIYTCTSNAYFRVDKRVDKMSALTGVFIFLYH